MAGPDHHERQRRRILDAARDLFSDRGFDSVTMAEVATSAGVSRATVFNHFRSKAGLVDSTVAGVMAFYDSMLATALNDETTSTADLVVAIFRQMAEGIELDRRYYRGVFREIARFQFGIDEGDAGHEASLRARRRMIELLQRGLDRGDVCGDRRAESLASAINALSNGTITEWLYNDDPSSLVDRMTEAAELLVCAIEAPSVQRPTTDRREAAGGRVHP